MHGPYPWVEIFDLAPKPWIVRIQKIHILFWSTSCMWAPHFFNWYGALICATLFTVIPGHGSISILQISQIYLSYYRYVIINFEHVVNFEKREHNLHWNSYRYSFQAFSVLTIDKKPITYMYDTKSKCISTKSSLRTWLKTIENSKCKA